MKDRWTVKDHASFGPVTQGYSGSSMGSDASLTQAKRPMSGCNWTQLLTAKGGPGESPGRAAAVSDALAATAEKKRVRRELEELKAKRKRRGR